MDPNIQKQLLSQLRDINAPDEIGIWPLAIGWWILIIAAVSLLILFSVQFIQRKKQNAYRKVAIIELDRLYAMNLQAVQYTQQANMVLKRCLKHLPLSQQHMVKTGATWVNCLNLFAKTPLQDSTSTALSYGLYQNELTLDTAQLHIDLKRWINTHTRRPAS